MFINKIINLEGGGNIREIFSLDIDFVFLRSFLFKVCDLCEMNLKNVSVVIISKKNYFRKKFNEFNIYKKLFSDSRREKIFVGIKLCDYDGERDGVCLCWDFVWLVFY